MSLSKRYIALTIMIMCFQALFFVPILSAPEEITLGVSTDLVGMLLGSSSLILHYQSIGLISIVLADLSIAMFPIIYKNIDKIKIYAYKDRLTYLFGSVISGGILIRSSMTLSEWQTYAIFIELILSLQVVIMIINAVGNLKITSSPTLVFFAWNILTLILGEIYFQVTSAKSEQWIVVLFSIVMFIFSIYIANHFLCAKRNFKIAYISPVRRYQIVDSIKLNASQVDIILVAVTSMGLGVVGSCFNEPTEGVMLLDNLLYFLIFTIVLYGITSVSTREKSKLHIWYSHIETMGGKIVERNKMQKDTSRAILKWVNNRIWEQWFVLLLFLIAADIFNMWLILNELAPVSYIAGFGTWLLVNTFLDMKKQYNKLVYTYGA